MSVWACMLMALLPLMGTAQTVADGQEAVKAMLDRIGGKGTAERFVVTVDESVAVNGHEAFVIGAAEGKPCIKGSTTSALTTGVNWYLNHYAHVNLTWNQLTTDLTKVTLPLPTAEEKHTCSVPYRYYLNYCTFSYSMSTWTWERWQQEIDWMALHGINMPLQIVGLDVVWYNLLTKDLGYTPKEANDFVAGPCFQAWWGMNNLQGWGGPNPEWWYTRQEKLAKDINARMRELGIEPVLPGYSGMVPSNITAKKGYKANNQGKWCNFLRPFILDPNSAAFTEVSGLYYKRLAEVMGTSKYYSMDPFHEGANTAGIDVRTAYGKIAEAMTKAQADSKWVIQFWQWNGDQYNVLDMVKKGKLIVLDLFSDAHTHFGAYKGHDAVYCALPNFGGRTGLFGRINKIMSDFYKQKAAFPNIKGIGATPEAIEQAPIVYDALFELPWRATAPDAKAWVEEYTLARYGVDNALAKQAWEKVRNTALNCETGLQGPHEAVLCARPALQVNSVSSWGGCGIFYDAQELADAAYLLLQAKDELKGKNYSFDLTDLARQALTDYGYYLLQNIKKAHDSGDKVAYAQRRDAYLQLILDLDELLNTNENFMLGRWTQMARGIADEAKGTTTLDKEWLELNNARTIITTWGDRDQSEWGGLRDYSYREWGGMMKDFYYNRWKTFFDNMDAGKGQPDWFDMDWAWAHNKKLSYSDQPVGNTAEVAERLFAKYFLNIRVNENKVLHAYRCMESDASDQMVAGALRGADYTFPVVGLPKGEKVKVAVDFNNDNTMAPEEMADGLTIGIPADAMTGKVRAQLMLNDGTVLSYRLTLKDEIKVARTVTVKTANAQQGKVAIEGTDALSVTNKDEVTVMATAVSGYNFAQWTDAKGTVISTENPYTYLGAEAMDLTANFMVNRWGSPVEDRKEWGDISSYGQYLTSVKVAQNGADEQTIYTATACPENLCQTTQMMNAPRGSKFAIHWNDAGGMNYCRLSAYIDLNGDGDFEDENEFLKVEGTKNQAGSNMLHDYTLEVLLPYDMPMGTTMLRLRFDGAWQNDGLNEYDAKPAKANTMRMVYDVPVNITSKAATACTVTVKSENERLGTVDANGQTLTYTYRTDEQVILRSYPVEGYMLKNWTDQYGRVVPAEWMEGNKITFNAPESGTYTAHFKMKSKPGKFGSWTIGYEKQPQGLFLTEVVDGNGVLDLTTVIDGMPVTGMAAGLMNNQPELTEVRMPATLVEMGNVLWTRTVEGTGKAVGFTPKSAIANNQAWTMMMNVENNGKSFNEWGSTLLATGDDAFANTFNGGFQLYLKSAQQGGDLIVKLNGDEHHFAAVKGNFSLLMCYDGKGQLTTTLVRADNKRETLTMAHRMNSIKQMAYGMPVGMAITRLACLSEEVNEAPFQHCSALTTIEVEAGNPLFASEDGVLLNAAGNQLQSYPEGRFYHKCYVLKNKKNGRYLTADPLADASGEVIVSGTNAADRWVSLSPNRTAVMLWRMQRVNGKDVLVHLNSQTYLGGVSGKGNEGDKLTLEKAADKGNPIRMEYVKPFNAQLKATVKVLMDDAKPYMMSGATEYLTLASNATTGMAVQWELAEVKEVKLSLPAEGWTTTCFPVNVCIPETEKGIFYTAPRMHEGMLELKALKAGTVVAAGTGLIVEALNGTTSLMMPLAPEAQATPADNLMEGTCVQRQGMQKDAFYTLQMVDAKPNMVRSSHTMVEVNSAYLLKNKANSEALNIGLWNGNGTGIAPLCWPTEEEALYNLQGQRVYFPTKGIYVTRSGKKLWIR